MIIIPVLQCRVNIGITIPYIKYTSKCECCTSENKSSVTKTGRKKLETCYPAAISPALVCPKNRLLFCSIYVAAIPIIRRYLNIISHLLL